MRQTYQGQLRRSPHQTGGVSMGKLLVGVRRPEHHQRCHKNAAEDSQEGDARRPDAGRKSIASVRLRSGHAST
jgi:hypothetical protein